ncbi:hypothetical protein ACHAQA_000307 [Verticillium albo-atrum]
MAYDRDEFIRLLTDYYEFCGRVFWNATAITQPPAGGWPSINQETLASLQKNDVAIDLLRHLPYPDTPTQKIVDVPHLVPETPVVDYRHEEVQKKIHEGELALVAEPYATTPPHCVGIAITGSRYGYWVILNTEDGRIYWGNPDGQHDEPAPELNAVLEQEAGGPGVSKWWDGYNVYEPADFFAVCKERFRDMNWIGMGPASIEYVSYDMGWGYESEPDSDSDEEDDQSHSKLARMMVAAGWPGDGEGRGWDKEKFVRLLNGRDGEEEEE